MCTKHEDYFIQFRNEIFRNSYSHFEPLANALLLAELPFANRLIQTCCLKGREKKTMRKKWSENFHLVRGFIVGGTLRRRFVQFTSLHRPFLSSNVSKYTNYERKLNYLVHVKFLRLFAFSAQSNRKRKKKMVSVADVTYSLVSINSVSASATFASPLIVATVFRNFISTALALASFSNWIFFSCAAGWNKLVPFFLCIWCSALFFPGNNDSIIVTLRARNNYYFIDN